jgi:hypothetical protein
VSDTMSQPGAKHQPTHVGTNKVGRVGLWNEEIPRKPGRIQVQTPTVCAMLSSTWCWCLAERWYGPHFSPGMAACKA